MVFAGGTSNSPTHEIEATASPSLGLKMRTPCVARPVLRISERLVRITCAFSETTYTSSLSAMTSAAATGPVRFVTDIVFMPRPPRPWVL